MLSIAEVVIEHFRGFETESHAENFMMAALRPYCAKIEQQIPMPNGLRPDITFALNSLPDIPLHAECKNFVQAQGPAAVLCDAIRQAASYSDFTRRPSFVGPIFARGVNKLSWLESPFGLAFLLAAQFNVGLLMFTPEHLRGRFPSIGTMILGGQALATFTFDEQGRPDTRLHSNARHLLKFKERLGSFSRKAE